MRLRSLRSVLLLLLVSAAAPAHAAEPRTLLVRGRVLGPEGWPVAGVTVAATGTRTASTVSDGQGSYALYVPLPTAREVARAPLVLRLTPVREGWSFVRAGGKGVAGLEAEIVGPPARVRVRAPDAAFADAVAGALSARSVSVVFADLDFTGAPSATAVVDAPVEMLGQAIVPVSGVKLARPAKPATPLVGATPTPRAEPGAAPKPSGPGIGSGAPPVSARDPGAEAARGARPRADSLDAAMRKARDAAARAAMSRIDSVRAATARALAQRAAGGPASPPPVPDAGRAVPSAPPSVAASAHPAPPATADSCECVIKGTIEARSDRRIPEYLRVSVWLADRPVSRDSVELFMGSPRPFEMRAPCGAHQLELLVEPRLQRFALRPPEAFRGFTCVRVSPSQWRLVLVVK